MSLENPDARPVTFIVEALHVASADRGLAADHEINPGTVIARRTGRIVVVARLSSGRVLGRSVVMARHIGRMIVRITLSPTHLVTGNITVSARLAGGTPVLVTRPAG